MGGLGGSITPRYYEKKIANADKQGADHLTLEGGGG